MADEEVQYISAVFGSPDPIFSRKTLGGLEEAKNDQFSKALVEIVSTNSLGPALRRKAYRKKAKANDPGSKSIAEETTGYTLLEVAQPKYDLDQLADLYEKSVPNGAAIRAKVANIVGNGYELVVTKEAQFKLDKKTGTASDNALRKVEQSRFDVDRWLTGLTKGPDFIDVLSRVLIDFESTGNGYIEVARKANGEIGYLGHIPAVTMRVRKARDGFVQISRDKAQFFRNFGDTDTPDLIGNDPRPNEVIHLLKYTPSSGYYGIPDIVSALTAVAGTRFADEYNLEYFENKAVPRYVIKTKGPQLSSIAQTKIAEFFSANVKGKNHRTVYIPLPPDTKDSKNDFEIVPVETKTQDSSFENYLKNNLANILMAHGTPHTKVLSAADAATLASAKDFDKTYKEQVVRPEQNVFNYSINLVLKTFTDLFEFKLKTFSTNDELTQAEIDDTEIKNDTALPNEVRRRKGLPPLEDGDTTFSAKQQKISQAAKADASAQPRAEAKAQANGTRARDAARTTGATDSKGQARNPKGEGRTVK